MDGCGKKKSKAEGRRKRGGKWLSERKRERGGDVSWRDPHYGENTPGLPGIPWETDLVAESEFHLRRTKD